MSKILITGGAGFIGAHVVKYFVKNYPDYQIFNLDDLTYAGNLMNLQDVEDSPNYTFLKGDITDQEFVAGLFNKYMFDSVIHLAAESHVDRSITGPMAFIQTNIAGTVNLLNAAKEYWSGDSNVFLHVSTDEVYGSLGPEGYFTETTPYQPKSPYSASKASADHFVRAYHNTYNLPVMITNCSNNYGPYQFPEKLIPLIINNIKNNKSLPVYGEGQNVRDWLYVEDHVRALDKVFHYGRNGETYNIGGDNEWKNIDLVRKLCDLTDEALGRSVGVSKELIRFVKDRAGHDLRYAIDASKIKRELGWEPLTSFEEGLANTIQWYLSNPEWLEKVTSGEYQEYYSKHYNLD